MNAGQERLEKLPFGGLAICRKAHPLPEVRYGLA
jgi:hypothetical protein